MSGNCAVRTKIRPKRLIRTSATRRTRPLPLATECPTWRVPEFFLYTAPRDRGGGRSELAAGNAVDPDPRAARMEGADGRRRRRVAARLSRLHSRTGPCGSRALKPSRIRRNPSRKSTLASQPSSRMARDTSRRATPDLPGAIGREDRLRRRPRSLTSFKRLEQFEHRGLPTPVRC